jgi:hypothetical protein
MTFTTTRTVPQTATLNHLLVVMFDYRHILKPYAYELAENETDQTRCPWTMEKRNYGVNLYLVTNSRSSPRLWQINY